MNKVVYVGVGVWLLALTYLSLQPTAKFSGNADAPVIAYVHGDSLQQGMKLIKTLEATLFSNVATVDSMLKEQAAPLQVEAQELISYANSGSATDSEISIAQTRVYEIEAILQQMQVEAEKSVQFQEQTMQATVAVFLTKTLTEYAEDNNIDYILNWGLSGEGVLYGSEAYDVTSEVLEKLNAE
jgi:Skp family chaperone for outer membrane proteins